MTNIFYIFSNGQFLGEELVRQVSQKRLVKYIDFSKYPNRLIASIVLIIKLLHFTIISRLKRKVIHIHYPNRLLYLLLPLFSILSSRLVITFWGSDFYANKSLISGNLGNMERNVDKITFTNEATLSEFVRCFSYTGAVETTRFGLTPLDYISNYDSTKLTSTVVKRIITARENTKTVMVGTNVSKNQQLETLIPLLNDYSNKGEFTFIFCFNYGDLELAKSLSKKISESLNCIIIRDKLYGHDLAALRINTDILIQVQLTDQLSGAMQETLYAGGKVITGRWLPYQVLLDLNIKISLVDNVGPEILTKLDLLACTRESYTENKAKIATLSSWKQCLCNWLKLYDE